MKTFSTIVVLLPALFLQACVGVPVAAPEEKPFRQIVEKEFIIGQTTTDEFTVRLGKPTLRDGTQWVYRESRDGWTWLVCATIIVNAGCTTTERTSEDFFLVAEFDSNDTLAAIEVLDSDGLCDTRQLCFHEELLMRAADVDAANKLSNIAGERCLVYIYSVGAKDAYAGRIEIDGRQVGDLVSDDGYYMRRLAPGKHLVAIFSNTGTRHEQPIAATVRCAGGEVLYLQYTPGFWSSYLNLVNPGIAQAEIRARWLAKAEVNAGPVELRWLADDILVVRRNGYHLQVFRNAGPGKLTSWAVSYDGEVCGIEVALADYDLNPAGGVNHFKFVDGSTSVKFSAICSADGQCSFPSLFKGERCRVWQDEKILYPRGSRLLVIEPNGDSYREVYFGDTEEFEDHADCDRDDCVLAINTLRTANLDKTLGK